MELCGRQHYFWHHNAHEMCKNKLTHGCLITLFISETCWEQWQCRNGALSLTLSHWWVLWYHFLTSRIASTWKKLNVLRILRKTFQVWRVTKKMKLLKSLKTRITATNLPYESVKCAFSKGQFKEKVGVKEKQQLVTNWTCILHHPPSIKWHSCD